jgi:2-phosphosulfolactate phosphatase
MSGRTVVVDCFEERLPLYTGTHAIVAVDVIRSTTTAVTAVAGGRRCLPVSTVAEAAEVARTVTDALMVGELHGDVPDGFDFGNSPAAVAARNDVWRPIVLLSTSGTRLIREAASADAVYVACLRNDAATASAIAGRHPRVAVIGAGSLGEFREEDQLCCARIAGALIEEGYQPEGDTEEIVERWRGVDIDAVAVGPSADFLRRTGQTDDLEFVLQHVDDVDSAYVFDGLEVVLASTAPSRTGP